MLRSRRAHRETTANTNVDPVLRTIIAHMPAVVWAMDRDLRFTMSHGGGLDRLGIAPGDVVGTDIFEYFGTTDRDHLPIAAHIAALRGDGSTYELDYDGRSFLTRVEPLWEGDEVVGLVGMAFDITDRRESEHDLATAYATLRAVEASRRDLLVRLLRARELEASRLAADLHDGPVQRFTAVGLRLASLRGRVADPAAREAIADLETHVGEGIDALRSLMLELVPPELELDDLAAAVETLLRRFEQESGTTAHLELGLSAPPSREVANTCYRNVREALRNVQEHGHARVVTVSVGSDERFISVAVHDDGDGFDPSVAEVEGHIGLRGMRERVESMDGHLDVDSAPGRGTTVAFSLPLAGTSQRAVGP